MAWTRAQMHRTLVKLIIFQPDKNEVPPEEENIVVHTSNQTKLDQRKIIMIII
jgi:hypothetical protein